MVIGAAVLAGTPAKGVCVDLLHLVSLSHGKQLAGLFALASDFL